MPPGHSKPYTTHSVISKDGTVFGWRQLGRGPGVIIVHGGMQASQSFMRLATALSDEHTVHVVDRRGRGLSGTFGENYCLARDCEDIAALCDATGARNIFGLSSGAIIALRSALLLPQLQRVALYEPPFSIHGSSPTGWLARYDREVAEGKLADALITALKGISVEPILGHVPRFILSPLLAAGIRREGRGNGGKGDNGDHVPLRVLIPTQHFDLKLVAETADTLSDYAQLAAEVLLLGGGKSPAFLRHTLDALNEILPNVHRITFPGLRHSGPDDTGKPEQVAASLREFFRTSTATKSSSRLTAPP